MKRTDTGWGCAMVDMAVPQPADANHHCRILIVEDDCSIASLIADVLEDEIGVSTVTLHNGAEAIRFLAQQEVSLVVLDYQLPGANGIQICDAMRHLAPARETPVLFVTANAEQADFRTRGLPYIRKPFDLTEFLTTVEQCLQHSQATTASAVL